MHYITPMGCKQHYTECHLHDILSVLMILCLYLYVEFIGAAVCNVRSCNISQFQNNRRKRSKSKQHQGNKDPKNKNDGPEKASQEPQGVYGCHLNGCSKDNNCSDSANEKLEAASLENKGSRFVASVPVCPEITGQFIWHKTPF